MRNVIFLACAVSCIMINANPVHSAEPGDEKLEAFFKAYLEEQFQRRPLEATLLGDHRFDQLLDDLSPQQII